MTPAEHALFRKLLALIGLVLLGIAGWAAYQQHYVVHGRFIAGYVAVVEGNDAYWSAGSLACLGVALFGPLFRRLALVVTWMSFWMTLAVLLPVGHADLR